MWKKGWEIQKIPITVKNIFYKIISSPYQPFINIDPLPTSYSKAWLVAACMDTIAMAHSWPDKGKNVFISFGSEASLFIQYN